MVKFSKIDKSLFQLTFCSMPPLYLSIKSNTTIYNKFEIVLSCIEEMSNLIGKRFDDFFYDLLFRYQKCETDEMRFKILENSVNKTIQFSIVFLNAGSLLYAGFSDIEKTKNEYYFFDLNDIKKIMKLSVSLKVFSSFLYAEKGINIDNQRKIYDKFFILLKAQRLPSKIMKYVEIIAKNTKMLQVKYGIRNYYDEDYSTDICVLEAFKFIFNNGFIIHDYKRNPIPFFKKIIEKQVEYSILKKQIIYIDDIDNHEGKNTSKTYKKKSAESVIAEKYVLKQLYNTSKYFISRIHQTYAGKNILKIGFNGHIDKIVYTSPIWEFILAPILFKAININYKQLLKVGPKHVACISFYLGHQLNKIFLNQYNNFLKLSFVFPTKPVTKGYYRLKNISYFLNSTHHTPIYDSFIFNGSRINIVRTLEFFIEKILSTEFKSTFDGRPEKIEINDEFEIETINFVLMFLKGDFQNEVEKLKKIFDDDLETYGQSINSIQPTKANFFP